MVGGAEHVSEFVGEHQRHRSATNNDVGSGPVPFRNNVCTAEATARFEAFARRRASGGC